MADQRVSLSKLNNGVQNGNGPLPRGEMQSTNLLQRIANTGEEIPKLWQVAMLLCSLPKSFDPLTTTLEQRPAKELDMNLVKSKLLTEAKKRRVRSGGAYGTHSEKALLTKARRGSRRNTGDPPLCHHCQKPGQIKRNGRLWKKSVSAGSKKKEEETGEEENEKILLCFLVGHGEPRVWFIDRRFFSALKEISDAGVVLADGTKAEVAGIGNGRIVGLNENEDAVEILLEDVLFVPKLKSGSCVVLERNRCEIRNQCKEVMRMATKNGSLYKLCTKDHALACVQQLYTVDHRQPWAETVITATNVYNRTQSRLYEVTPYEKWNGKTPSGTDEKIFGTKVWVPSSKKQKERELIFVGYSEQDEEYRLLDKTTGKRINQQ